MDSYQAVYDAVRSRMPSVDLYDAVFRALDFSHEKSIATQEIVSSASAAFKHYTTPSVMYRPTLSIDGDKWCALYGNNLQEGVAGFGDSPAEAMQNFDAAWSKKLGDSDGAK